MINLDDNHQVGTTKWADGDTMSGGQGAATAGLTCDINPNETYHVHTHLSVFLDGQQIAVPGQIGIIPQSGGGHCFYALHTHDKSGKLHVEAGAPATFTLGQIFDIWGQPLQGDNFAGITGKEVVIYVTDAGVVTQATGDWRNIELSSHREITVQIGSAITEIPNYTWSAN